ncbi:MULTISPECIES: three-Cys-motif partner protein TcmP [unclassified Streptomyces]|uniref:three-Cys-motif partner protein TcmP n=1 Tax=unclassified Streptomyces TaxID=2593676 RepID=UPI0029A51C87|nr:MULTISPECIES: three-Cys-motif partner protein TcmP [unclassified Streptomyces]MDX3771218.1 three-Cys-motif partner protein TcmP [Streptomyces sp. AK08-01B]MDX3820743.1 three-Cys-motif partner protein TcmP [Streptomyces sp. AK08-01A]
MCSMTWCVRRSGVPLILFLDPCGLCLPMERLVDVLAQHRRERRPATELLMTFSMMAVQRLGGHVRSPKGNERSLERFDEVCGGPWRREYFAAGRPGQDAAEAVAAEYKRRLAQQTDMFVQSVAVAHSPSVKPVYHLVFATRSQYGLWVFGDTVARARDEWWKTLELREEGTDLALFSMASVSRPDPKEVEAKAVPEIADHLEELLRRMGRPGRDAVAAGGRVPGRLGPFDGAAVAHRSPPAAVVHTVTPPRADVCCLTMPRPRAYRAQQSVIRRLLIASRSPIIRTSVPKLSSRARCSRCR